MYEHPKDPQNIVKLNDFHAHHSFSAIAQVEAYWEGLRQDRLLPKRSDIDPRGIEAALEYAFILERVAPGVARMRIAGSHLSDLMGMEVRGMPITAFLSTESRRRFSDTLEELFSTPAVGTLALRNETGAAEGRMVLLPLKSDMGDVTRMLGCFVTKGDIAADPCRFNIEDIQVRPLMAQQPVFDRAPQPPVADAPKAQRPVRQQCTDGGSVPYLRLVKSDS
ncbi:PAS domain-containing protein [Sulfitobacter marinus]|uniref:PAS domain-containing protein n=1 Tax=Sulfitobacter marinus TaxID=394264 RepID=A0A1I6QTC5_9RHOB|nr:PAS domain-containing protein [Sulfitobacter marinus]SFS55736.1 PAS domain-containing protein [Sulfitobacter marinus]